jgi:hypothetical protein
MLLREFTPNKTQFSRRLSDPTMKMGFECEVMLSQEASDDDEGEREVDWDRERERINEMDWDDVSNYVGDRIRRRIDRDYEYWFEVKLSEAWDQDWWDETKKYCIDNDLINEDEPSDADEGILNDPENIAAAKENWINENRDQYESDYDMDEYINSEFRYMSNFCREFDIEIEPDDASYYTPERYDDDSTEQIHREAAYSLGDAVGEAVTVGSASAAYWHVIEDGSLSGEGTGMEIVSPVFSPLSEGLDALKKVFDWIADYDASTTHQTGLHVSFSIDGKDVEDYDYLKMIIMFDENYTAKMFDRMNNRYAEQMRQKIFAGLNEKTDVEHLSERQISNMVAMLSRLGRTVHSISEKYFSFRHRAHGVFEFRNMGGDDYHEKYDEIRKRIVTMASIMQLGSDPNLMAKEYIKRVYKLLSSEKFSDPQTVSKDPKDKAINYVAKMSAEMPAFSMMFSKNKKFAKTAAEDAMIFLHGIAMLPGRLDPRQIQQLRLYAGRRKQDLHFAEWRENDPDGYNKIASYLRLPLVIAGDEGQGTLPFATPGKPKPEPKPERDDSYQRRDYNQHILQGIRNRAY